MKVSHTHDICYRQLSLLSSRTTPGRLLAWSPSFSDTRSARECSIQSCVCRSTHRDSLIPETLKELEADEELVQLHDNIARRGQRSLTEEEDALRRKTLENLGTKPFKAMCEKEGVTALRRGRANIFQLNIGLYCNQACRHCHVESSPKRTEMMSHQVAEQCVSLMDASDGIETVDLTGGAPELCPEFRYLVREARARGLEVIDRCNLTVLLEPGQETLAEFLAENKVKVVASMPCYSKENVDSQRGGGVFGRSIRGLQMLNAVGYGMPGSDLTLDLVYNPGGVFLAPPASSLEDAYKQELKEAYGISFNNLLCLNNMPIKRWADELVKRYVNDTCVWKSRCVVMRPCSTSVGVRWRHTWNCL